MWIKIRFTSAVNVTVDNFIDTANWLVKVSTKVASCNHSFFLSLDMMTNSEHLVHYFVISNKKKNS